MVIHISVVIFAIALSVSTAQYSPDQQGYSQRDDGCCDDYCYMQDGDPYVYFSTKTSYELLNLKTHYQAVAECQPLQFWSLNRHGATLPDASEIERLKHLENVKEDFIRNYEQRRSYPSNGRLCDQDFDLLKRWRWNSSITSQRANSLTTEGMNEIKLLATRYRAKFGELFRNPGDERAFHFQYTDKAHDSYQAYIEGLFGTEYYRIHANTYTDDKLIQPSRNCKIWSEHVDENQDIQSNYLSFTERQDYKQMTHEVFRRLGFRYDKNSSVFSDIYDMCSYEKAWHVDQPSPWCAAFTKNHLKMLEYAEDLKYYYKFGYGNPLSEKLGCAAVKDMYRKFEDSINGQYDGKKVSAFFTDSAAFQTVLTAMGIAKDSSPLKADNYYYQSQRNWRTSLIDPFAANLVAVLYRCDGDRDKYKVLFLLNEVPVVYEGCSVGLCTWPTVRNKFMDLVDGCNVEDFCEGNSGNRNYFSYLLYLFVITCTFYFKI